MKALIKRMNLAYGEVEGAHVFKRVNLGFDEYDNLCLACAELNINLDDVMDSDFDSCGIHLLDFIESATEDTGYTVSIWFDK